ncbi:hypothetical protein AAVH_10766 [Aphelenchoides avenae]|nr:hypothetical protein AAVH_10766 [Aphelenchus avenae]
MNAAIFSIVLCSSVLNDIAYACSCPPNPGYDREDIVNNYEWVSRSKVLYKSYDNGSQWLSDWTMYQVRHLDIFKTNGSELGSELLTPSHSGNCQVEWNARALEVGEQYLLTGFFKDTIPHMELCYSLARPWMYVHADTLHRLGQLEFVGSHPDECEETPEKCHWGMKCVTQPNSYTCLNDTVALDCVGDTCKTLYSLGQPSV